MLRYALLAALFTSLANQRSATVRYGTTEPSTDGNFRCLSLSHLTLFPKSRQFKIQGAAGFSGFSVRLVFELLGIFDHRINIPANFFLVKMSLSCHNRDFHNVLATSKDFWWFSEDFQNDAENVPTSFEHFRSYLMLWYSLDTKSTWSTFLEYFWETELNFRSCVEEWIVWICKSGMRIVFNT